MRTGTVVYKYDESGELIHTYTSFIKAYKGEKTSFGKMRDAVDNGIPLNGFTFETGRRCTLSPKPKEESPKTIWDAKDGLFNVETWRSICF